MSNPAMQQLGQELERLMNDPDYRIPEAEQLPALSRAELDKAIDGWEKDLKGKKFDTHRRLEGMMDVARLEKEKYQKHLKIWVYSGAEKEYKLAEKAKKNCEETERRIAEAEQKLRELDEQFKNLPFTTYEDECIMYFHKTLGPKWEEIAQIVEKSPVAVKNRVMLLKLKDNLKK